MAIRRLSIASAVLVTLWLLVSACSETARYRVLKFFFDGVPKPASLRPRPTTPEGEPAAEQKQPPTTAARRRKVKVYSHPPYLANRCGACHSVEDGQPFKSVEEGLCLSCHTGFPGDVRYVHGPVNANACLFCHHHHVASYPHVLRDEPTKLCLRCHDRTDLTAGPHHENLDQQSCTDCHNPHGGNDRFFLLPAKR